jgi:hypothetical protein
MKNIEEFTRFLRRKGKKEHVVNGLIDHCLFFDNYLVEQRGTNIDSANKDEMTMFVQELENRKMDYTNILRGIALYYEFQSREYLCRYAGSLREKRLSETRKIFKIRDFRGVNTDYVARLEAVGIQNTEQMLQAGRTPGDRQAISVRTGIPVEAILEFVKLSDISRLGAIKSIRARLYYDAGVDTPDKFAQWDPEELRTMLTAFVQHTGFDGIPPLPKEVQGAVRRAKEITKIVEYG